MPKEFGAWSTVHNRFRQWRDAGVFEALLEGVITEAAKRGVSLVSADSTTGRAHHDAAGMHLDSDNADLEQAAEEAEKARQKGAARRNKTSRTPHTTRNGTSDDVMGAGASSA